MTTIYLVVVAVVVVGILAVAVLALFELTPFAHRTNPYRDPVSGRRRFESPHLEGWDEYERRTHDNLN